MSGGLIRSIRQKLNMNFLHIGQLIPLLILWNDRICPVEAEQKLDGAAVEFWMCLIILRCFVIAGLLLFFSLFAACVRLSLPNLLAFSCLFERKKREKKQLFSLDIWKWVWQAWHIFQPKLFFFCCLLVLFSFFALFFGVHQDLQSLDISSCFLSLSKVVLVQWVLNKWNAPVGMWAARQRHQSN